MENYNMLHPNLVLKPPSILTRHYFEFYFNSFQQVLVQKINRRNKSIISEETVSNVQFMILSRLYIFNGFYIESFWINKSIKN